MLVLQCLLQLGYKLSKTTPPISHILDLDSRTEQLITNGRGLLYSKHTHTTTSTGQAYIHTWHRSAGVLPRRVVMATRGRCSGSRRAARTQYWCR